MSVIRWLARLLIPLAVAGALVFDARTAEVVSDAAETIPQAAPAVVTIPDAEALTSSWFCPAVGLRSSLDAMGEVTSEVLLTNLSPEAISVSVEFRGRTTGRRTVSAGVAAHSTAALRTSDHASDEVVGALIEASAGGLAVTRRFASPHGIDEARCTSVLAPTWHVPVGDTQADAATLLAIMNPLPRDSIVDVVFASESEFGPFVAPELTGVVVPKSSTLVVDVGAHARRRDAVAATVQTRTGRVAVDVFGAYDGSVGRRGFAAELASPAPSETWLLATPGIDTETSLWLRVLNPSDQVAEVSVSAQAGEEAGSASDAISVAVPAQDVAELTVEAPSERAPGLDALVTEPGVPLAFSVSSANGVPLVVWAEVLVGDTANPLTDIRADASGESATPAGGTGGSPGSGLAYIVGSGQPRSQWLVVAASETGAEAFLTVAGASVDLGIQEGDEIAVTASGVRIATLAGESVAEVEVPGEGAAIHSLNSGTTRLVTADGPVFVALTQSRPASRGLSVAYPLGY